MSSTSEMGAINGLVQETLFLKMAELFLCDKVEHI